VDGGGARGVVLHRPPALLTPRETPGTPLNL
jgi:hypothetical protein